MSHLLQHLNPLHYVGQEKYQHFWQALFQTLLQGFWGRLIAVTFLLLSLWYGIRKGNLPLGVLFFVLALIMPFAAPALKFVGLL